MNGFRLVEDALALRISLHVRQAHPVAMFLALYDLVLGWEDDSRVVSFRLLLGWEANQVRIPVPFFVRPLQNLP